MGFKAAALVAYCVLQQAIYTAVANFLRGASEKFAP